MFEAIKLKIIQFLVKKYALGYLIQVYVLVKGYKTQLCLAGMIIVWVLERFQVIPGETASAIYPYLSGAGTIALGAKLKSYKDVADAIAKQVLAGADKGTQPVNNPPFPPELK